MDDNGEATDMNELLAPLWAGNLVSDEKLLPLRTRENRLEPMPLLYHADEILAVRCPARNIVYEAGRDYALEDGCLRLPEGSSIPAMEPATEDTPRKCALLQGLRRSSPFTAVQNGSGSEDAANRASSSRSAP